MSWKRKILLHLNAGILLVLLAGATEGAPFSVRVGFGGAFLPGAWTPIAIEIDGAQAPARGALEVAVPLSTSLNAPSQYSRYLLPYSLDAPGPFRSWIALPLQGGREPLLVRLRGEDGSVLAEERIPLGGAGASGRLSGRLVLVLDPAEESWAWIPFDRNQGERTPRIEQVAVGYAADPLEFPDNALSLKALTAIAVRAGFPLQSLSRAQRAAIEEYVRLGGHLVLSGGASPPDFPAEWRSWLPGAATGRILTFEFPSGAVPGWELAAGAGDTLLDWQGRPIAISGRVGDGRVTFIAVEPSSPLSRSTPLEAAFKGLLLAEGRSHDPFRPFSDANYWAVLGALPGRRGAPSNLAWWLGAYTVICTGLGAWASRRKAALVAVALWIAAGVLFVGKYTESLGLRDRIAFREVQVTEGLPHGGGHVRAYASLLSLAPMEASETLAFGGAFFPFPRSFEQGQPLVELTSGSAAFPSLPPLTPVDFIYETAVETGVTLAWASEDLLVLSNQSGHRLRHVHLIERGRFAWLGSVDPHRELKVPYPPDTWVLSTLVPASVQSHLARMDRATRPDEFELQLIAAAIDEALRSRAVQEVRFVVALTEAVPLAIPAAAETVERRRVLLIPLPEREPTGGDLDEG